MSISKPKATHNLSKIDKNPLVAQRHKESDDCYFVACACLEQLEATQFQDRALAKKTSQFLMVAAKKNRSDSRPLIKLAYLVFVFGDDAKALLYLKRALEITPQSEAALTLKERIENHDPSQSHNPSEAMDMAHELHFASQEELNNMSSEELYAHLEETLSQQLDELENCMVNLKPTLLKSTLEDWEQDYQIFKNQNIHIKAQKQILESQNKLGELSQDLEDIDDLMNELKETIGLSHQFQNTMEEITETIDLVKQELKSLRKTNSNEDIAVLEDNLDGYWKSYERIADQLDQWDEAKLDIKPLERYFNPLGILLDKYQKITDRK